MLHPLVENAYKVLNGETLEREEALALADEIQGEDILDLISLANKVRHRFAPEIRACSILNAKSGVCTQNCRFCAQSAHHSTEIESYPLLPLEDVLEAAGKVYDAGIRAFGYVTSGYGYTDPADPDFLAICEQLDALHRRYPEMKLCVSIGILSRACAEVLASHHAWRYNMNLQTNPEAYGRLIATTHAIEDKIQTIRYLQEFGVTNCTGGILGLGESWADRVDMALAIRALDVEGIPLNVLLPIVGTPLEGRPSITPAEAAKAFALFRLLNPMKMIKFAAGRETRMKDFQGLLMLSGLNSMITGGYLTTRGRKVEDDQSFIAELEAF